MTINKRGALPISIDDDATASYAHLFQAFADPTRLAIIQHLSSGEHRVSDLVDHMNLAQSTVSNHVAFLAECGLVTARSEGRSNWYNLAEPGLVRILIAGAEELLAATGSPALLCSHIRGRAS